MLCLRENGTSSRQILLYVLITLANKRPRILVSLCMTVAINSEDETEEEVGRQHQGMDRPGVRQVPEGSGEQKKMEKTGCKIICGAPMTLAVKRLMMMMMINSYSLHAGHPIAMRIHDMFLYSFADDTALV